MTREKTESKILPFPRSYWIIPGKFLAGHVPTDRDKSISKKKLDSLISTGINVVINLQEENETYENGDNFEDYSQYIKQKGLEYHRIAIEDLSVPDIETMEHIQKLLNDRIKSNKTIYIHCWGGIGRTGTVVGCFLKDNKMADNSNVIETIEYLRRTEPSNSRQSPETHEQIDFIFNW